MTPDDKERFLCCIKAFVIAEVLVILLIVGVSNSWGACRTLTRSYPYNSPCGTGSLDGCVASCPSVNACSQNEYLASTTENLSCDFCSSIVGFCQIVGSITFTCCGSQAEADSVACVNGGSSWQNGQCQTVDTETLDSLEMACNALEGEANYNFNDQGNVVGYCDLCGLDSAGNYANPHVKAQYDEYAAGCCSSGMAPNPSAFSCKRDAGGCFGANCQWEPSSANGIGASKLGFSMGVCNVNITTTIDGEIEGCEDYTERPPESSPNPESSSGAGSQESSASTEEVIANGIEQILDSLHKIIVHDSMIRKFDSTSMQGIYRIADILDTLSVNNSDTTIVNVNVPRDTYNINVGSPDVNIDLDGVTAAIAANARIDSINGLSLDSIKELIRDLGVDSVRNLLTEQNGVLNGIDSALTDTSGGAYDTSGFMSEIRGWGDSLAAAVWGYPCDTTGGKKCDNAYIGSNGLATAQQDLKNAYSAGVDSIKNGAFGDSLRHWSNLITNNGVLSGAGSASCPSVFTRTWNVPLGPSGMSYTFGPFSKIVCYNFFAGITFWSLARVVLRILVAIGCMMWLYHAVTGTSGGNDDED